MGYAIERDDELCHYGILGMKWGIRRSPEQLAKDRSNLGGEASYAIIKKKYGSRGTSRISDNISKGNTIEDSIKKEDNRRMAMKIAKTAASIGLSIGVSELISPLLPIVASKIITSENIKIGQELLSKIITPENIKEGQKLLSDFITPETIEAAKQIVNNYE